MTSATNTIVHLCPCCGKQLDTTTQFFANNGKVKAVDIGTCRSRDCDYNSVTLSIEKWGQLATDATMQELYRNIGKV